VRERRPPAPTSTSISPLPTNARCIGVSSFTSKWSGATAAKSDHDCGRCVGILHSFAYGVVRLQSTFIGRYGLKPFWLVRIRRWAVVLLTLCSPR